MPSVRKSTTLQRGRVPQRTDYWDTWSAYQVTVSGILFVSFFFGFWFWTNNCTFPAFRENVFLGLLFLIISWSINNKLQQPMAAHGVLVYAMKNHGADVVRNLFIFWWSYDLYVHTNRSKGFFSHTTGSHAKPTAAAWPKLFQVH